jgi:glycosyltransferase involved in cell wall biosynthesis
MTRILLVEPWLHGSHLRWAEGYQAASRHRVGVVGLGGGLWRWRIRGGALPLARKVEDWVASNGQPDVLVVSGMVDVAELLGLTRHWLTSLPPVVIYQHESQLVYPSPSGTVDQEAALRNWLSWCAADLVVFNSHHHRNAVVSRLPGFLAGLPDHSHLPSMEEVVGRFEVLPVGVDVAAVRASVAERDQPAAGCPVLLWPHRWEPDKDPIAFASALARLAATGAAFNLILAGEDPPGGSTFAERSRQDVLTRFGDRVLASGPFERSRYLELLGRADLVVSCAKQELFGVGVVEAVAAGCVPLLPAKLSYPEVIPAQWHDTVLYQPGRFGSALSEAVDRLAERRRATEGLADAMTRFDWSKVAPAYDRTFADVLG